MTFNDHELSARGAVGCEQLISFVFTGQLKVKVLLAHQTQLDNNTILVFCAENLFWIYYIYLKSQMFITLFYSLLRFKPGLYIVLVKFWFTVQFFKPRRLYLWMKDEKYSQETQCAYTVNTN